MNTSLIIRVPPLITEFTSQTVLQWGLFSHHHKKQAYAGTVTKLSTLQQIADSLQNHDSDVSEIVILISSGLCFYQTVTVSAAQKKHLHTAAPYLIEESIAQDIDNLHVVHQTSDTTEVEIAAIDHQVIQQLLAQFAAHHLSPTKILPEQQLLQEQQPSLWLESDTLTFGSTHSSPIAISYDALPIFIQSLENAIQTNETDTETALHKINLYYADHHQAIPSANLKQVCAELRQLGWKPVTKPQAFSLFELLANRYLQQSNTKHCLNLRQQAYRCPSQTKRYWQKLKPIAAILAIGFIGHISLIVAEGFYYQHRANELWQTSIDAYLTVFPKDKQAQSAKNKNQLSFNPQPLLKARLKSSANNISESAFLPLLLSITDIATQQPLEPKTLQFSQANKQLVYEFTTKELATANQVVEQLTAAQLSAELNSANQTKTGVAARVTIKR